jgi:hypothetical protein
MTIYKAGTSDTTSTMHTCLLNEALRLADVAGEDPEGVAFILRSPPSSIGKRSRQSVERSNLRRGLHPARYDHPAVPAVCGRSGAAFRRLLTSSRATGQTGGRGTSNPGSSTRSSRGSADLRDAVTGALGFGYGPGKVGHCFRSFERIGADWPKPAFVDPAGRIEAASQTRGFSAILPIPMRT